MLVYTKKNKIAKPLDLDSKDSLRNEAEKKFGERSGKDEAIFSSNPEKLIYELRIHEIELELQNEELREARLALEESRDKYIDLYEFAPVGYLTLTKHAIIEEGNLTCAAMFGIDRRDLIHKSFRKFVVSEDLEHWDRHFISVLHSVDELTLTLELVKGDGSRLFGRLDGLRIQRENKNPVIRLAITDITTQKKAEEALEKAYADVEKQVGDRTLDLTTVNEELHLALEKLRTRELQLRESEEKFRIMADTIPQLAWIARADGYFIWVNQRCIDYTGKTAQELEGLGWQSIIEPSKLPAILEGWKASTAAGEMQDMEVDLRGADGMYRIFLTRVMPQKDPEGHVIKWFGTNTDITERKQIENALATVNKKLNILSSVTRHDILNQLTAFQGFLELYHEKCKVGAKADVYFENLVKSAKNIEHQIAFTKFYQEMGVKAPTWQKVQDVAGTAARAGPFGDTRFTVEAGSIAIFADPLLEKVFFNLYDNSTRHGEHVTEIRISVSLSDRNCIIIVEDNGVGVVVNDKERIFERGKGKHTGLGLFLAREILAITGITIRETGESGKGARFEILVPEGTFRLGGVS